MTTLEEIAERVLRECGIPASQYKINAIAAALQSYGDKRAAQERVTERERCAVVADNFAHDFGWSVAAAIRALT